MNISEVISILKAELVFKRTPCGRPINDFASESISAAIQDTKNHGYEVVKCKNCCIITSGLLVPDGCPNCGSKDLEHNINNV